MSTEFKGRKFLNLALAGVTLASVSHFAPQETKNALHALAHNPSSCAEIMPQNQIYDTIAVFGAGTYVDENGITQPNNYQDGRIKAAAAAYVAGYSDKILLIDAGPDQVQTATIGRIKKHVEELSGGSKIISESGIQILTNSLNTAENVADLQNFMLLNGLSKVLSVTDNFHYERLKLLIENYGVESEIATTECIAEYFVPFDTSWLESRENTAEMHRMRNKEWWAIFELSVDFRGRLTIALKNLNNPHEVRAAD
jgi:uncharacterized SAM-binding protein YcdF (DUF218 family)